MSIQPLCGAPYLWPVYEPMPLMMQFMDMPVPRPSVAVVEREPEPPAPKPSPEAYPTLAAIGFVFPDAMEVRSEAGVVTRSTCPTCGGALVRSVARVDPHT